MFQMLLQQYAVNLPTFTVNDLQKKLLSSVSWPELLLYSAFQKKGNLIYQKDNSGISL